MAKQTTAQYAAKVLKGRTIEVNNALMRGLGYDNTRDFFEELGNWGYNSDFGQFPASTDTNVQTYLRQFIKDQFVD